MGPRVEGASPDQVRCCSLSGITYLAWDVDFGKKAKYCTAPASSTLLTIGGTEAGSDITLVS